MKINENCIACTACVDQCQMAAIWPVKNENRYMISEALCIDCGDCKEICDNGCIS